MGSSFQMGVMQRVLFCFVLVTVFLAAVGSAAENENKNELENGEDGTKIAELNNGDMVRDTREAERKGLNKGKPKKGGKSKKKPKKKNKPTKKKGLNKGKSKKGGKYKK